MTTQFKESIETALNNGNLTGALGRFSEAYRVSRAKAYEGIDFEAVRDQIAGIKGSASSSRTRRPVVPRCSGPPTPRR